MSHPILVGLLYLFLATGLEFGALPVFRESLGEFAYYIPPSEIRLVALGVILSGALRDEAQALIYAVVGAIIAGSMPGPGHLGCTLFSFIVAATLTSILVRWLYMEHFTVRFAAFFALILAESWVASSARRAFWPDTRVEIQWWAHAFTALAGAALYPPLKRWLRLRPEPLLPIGRKKP